MVKKFINLLESFIDRTNNGGYMARDIVKFVKNYKSTDFYKNSTGYIQKCIDDMADSGLNIRIIDIISVDPSYAKGLNNVEARGTKFNLLIGLEQTPSGFVDNSKAITVSPELVELVEQDGINMPKYPDKFLKKFKEYSGSIKDYEKFLDKNNESHLRDLQTNFSMDKDKLTSINHNLPEKNIKITKESKESKDNNTLIESYVNILSSY